MKIIIPGGSGQVGTLLARAFHQQGHEVVVLSRHPKPAAWKTAFWDGINLGNWADHFDRANVVINLAGRSVNCRYHARNRRQILESRVLSTQAVGRAIVHVENPPSVWLQASTATIYAHRDDQANDDLTGQLGGQEPSVPNTWKFSVEVAQAWEKAATDFHLPDTRLVLLRSALTLHPDPGSVLDVLLRLVRFGLGGTQGSGKQFVSWIHHRDFVDAIHWILQHPELAGPINLASPFPITNADFLRTLRRAWGTAIGLPAPGWLLEIGALFLRTETELVLKSRRVVPTRLLQSGYSFHYPTWPQAAKNLCEGWKRPIDGSLGVRSRGWNGVFGD